MGIRLWIRGPRLPFGMRAGVSIPLSDLKPSGRQKPAVEAQSTTNLSYVYVIAGSQGTVKVGYSTNPQMRLAALQTASPGRLDLAYALATDIDGRMIEAEAHRILDRHRLAGEWFDVSPQIATEAVEQAARNMGLPLVSSDAASIARALESETKISEADEPKKMPTFSRFCYLLCNALGIIMTLFILLACLTDQKLQTAGISAFVILICVLAAPLFFVAWFIKRRWQSRLETEARLQSMGF